MSSYRSINLFGSGPHRFHVGGLTQRTAERSLTGADGVRLIARGRTGRAITQTGTLIDDDLAGLNAQADAIEAVLDGNPGDLVDDLSRTWSHIVMLGFEPGPVRRIGVRLGMDYTVRYSQVRA